jgi:hypothetical protein
MHKFFCTDVQKLNGFWWNSKIKNKKRYYLMVSDELKSSTMVKTKNERDKPEFHELLTRAMLLDQRDISPGLTH